MKLQTAECRFCHRLSHTVPYYQREGDLKAAYAYAVHDSYGCDTGCCGYRWYACDESGEILFMAEFDFMHDRDAFRAWAHKYGLHIHWEECNVP